MELTDIVSYIAFGRPASESLHLGGAVSGGSLATDIALGQVAGLIEGVAGSGLGLDVVEIEQQGLDTRLTAGKYVHSKLYLSISQPISLGGSTSGSTFGNKREITAEFELIESLLLRLLTKRGSISVNLLWQYAY
jgi:translocation and assembly module TamB